ncbi:RNA 2',3'-cyclic phosphodiesterase [Proteobacteria bacterium 005FR1]|nr:RNA 2',3'-cyclic phosphodiesterase [Proteobacteria bacterium 005FR1]
MIERLLIRSHKRKWSSFMNGDNEHKRLFFGLPVSSDIRQELTSLQPARGRSTRPIAPAQMHITLHFVGQADAGSLISAPGNLQEEAFTLDFQKLGYFGSARRGGILWIGFEEHPKLHRLHQRVGSGLRAAGLELDTRPFTPHVTLARCRPGAPAEVFESFLQQDLPALPPLSVSEVILYSSTTGPEGSVYQREYTWPLLRL